MPLIFNLPAGSALAIAQATDAALRPTPRQLLTFAESPVRLTFDEFYEGYNVRTGLILSDKLVSLDGKDVVIEGYMAPPLKAELDWFVLTRIRLAYRPFCSTAADWPDDIALIYLDGDTIRPTEKPLRLHGRLEVGPPQFQRRGWSAWCASMPASWRPVMEILVELLRHTYAASALEQRTC